MGIHMERLGKGLRVSGKIWLLFWQTHALEF